MASCTEFHSEECCRWVYSVKYVHRLTCYPSSLSRSTPLARQSAPSLLRHKWLVQQFLWTEKQTSFNTLLLEMQQFEIPTALILMNILIAYVYFEAIFYIVDFLCETKIAEHLIDFLCSIVSRYSIVELSHSWWLLGFQRAGVGSLRVDSRCCGSVHLIMAGILDCGGRDLRNSEG